MTHSFSLLFPGQGSQSVGMLSDLAAEFPEVEATFSQASAVFGDDLWALTQQGPAEKLNQTAYTQPALLAADIAVMRCFESAGAPKPSVVAGHSLGEYAALVCAEVLSFEDAVALVAKRGALMQSAVAKGEGAMAAVIGLDDQTVAMLCQEASNKSGVVSPANFNAIGQVVVAGETAAVDQVITLAKSAGAKMAKMIPVSVPSHCALMQPAADEMAKALKSVAMHRPKIPVIQNMDAAYHETPDQIREALIAQLTLPVQWVATVQRLVTQSVLVAFECGPGRVLAGLNKRIAKTISTTSLLTRVEIIDAIQVIVGES